MSVWGFPPAKALGTGKAAVTFLRLRLRFIAIFPLFSVCQSSHLLAPQSPTGLSDIQSYNFESRVLDLTSSSREALSLTAGLSVAVGTPCVREIRVSTGYRLPAVRFR